jgi:hypothetical protein
VPYADRNALVLPEEAQDKETDYVTLSDILPTGYQATELAGVGIDDSVVYGAAEADQVFVVDRQPHPAQARGADRRDPDRRQRRERRRTGAGAHRRPGR